MANSIESVEATISELTAALDTLDRTQQANKTLVEKLEQAELKLASAAVEINLLKSEIAAFEAEKQKEADEVYSDIEEAGTW